MCLDLTTFCLGPLGFLLQEFPNAFLPNTMVVGSYTNQRSDLTWLWLPIRLRA